MRPVRSGFLLRAAPDVAQQSNSSMAVSATIVTRKVGWLVCVRGLLSLFTLCPFVLQLKSIHNYSFLNNALKYEHR